MLCPFHTNLMVIIRKFWFDTFNFQMTQSVFSRFLNSTFNASKTLALLIPVVSASKKIEQSFILDENFLIKACQARKRRSRFLKVKVNLFQNVFFSKKNNEKFDKFLPQNIKSGQINKIKTPSYNIYHNLYIIHIKVIIVCLYLMI